MNFWTILSVPKFETQRSFGRWIANIWAFFRISLSQNTTLEIITEPIILFSLLKVVARCFFCNYPQLIQQIICTASVHVLCLILSSEMIEFNQIFVFGILSISRFMNWNDKRFRNVRLKYNLFVVLQVYALISCCILSKISIEMWE